MQLFLYTTWNIALYPSHINLYDKRSQVDAFGQMSNVRNKKLVRNFCRKTYGKKYVRVNTLARKIDLKPRKFENCD